MLVISLLLTILYVCLMALYCVGWQRQKDLAIPEGYQPYTSISVVIPARNEASNIAACINALLAQQYPAHLLQVIVVDDHSDDDTARIVQSFAGQGVQYVNLAQVLGSGTVNAYKKAALTAGICQARGELIVTTDADCTAPPYWLQHLSHCYENKGAAMLVAPVVFKDSNGMLQVFQTIDFMSMQGITAAAHALKLGKMSNGANLAFSKETFEQVGGYAGTEYLASGDDYLLLVKMSEAFPGQITYVKSKEAIVTTACQPSWKAFFRQRIRWASKSGKYKDPTLTRILLLVYMVNVCLVTLLVMGLIHFIYIKWWLLLMAIKTITELIFLWPVAGFFGRRRALRYFPLLQPLHTLYIVSAGFFGFMGGYEWKGRKVK